MADLFQVLTMMALPAAILLTLRCLIVRQNRTAQRAAGQPAVRRA